MTNQPGLRYLISRPVLYCIRVAGRMNPAWSGRNQYPPVFQKLGVACRLFFLFLLSLLLNFPAQAASLQEYPLLPVNTSGPRGTLRAFLTNAENAFAEFKKSGYRSKEALIYVQRAASTLDMSHVPLSSREDVAFEYTLRLKEILANIEVPEL